MNARKQFERFLEQQSIQRHIPSFVSYIISDVPKEHWCGHYLDPLDRRRVIQDGESCCFWHWIGLPKRWGVRHPAYPWQEKLFEEYFKEGIKYYYIGKVPKIGASQTWIQIAMHEALTNPTWVNGQVGIVVGTGGNEAEKMIERCKELIAYKDERNIPLRDHGGNLLTKFPINEDYNTKKEFSINSVEFRAYPANNVDSIRSKENMRLEIVDEIGFFTMIEQQTVRDAFEHYIGNSDVRIALITTAGKSASGVAYEIEIEDPSIYSHHLLDYHLGLEKHSESHTSLFDSVELEKLKTSSSWTRNYLRVWGHGSGNIFNSNVLDALSNDYYPLGDISEYPNVLALDPAYGEQRTKTSSKYAGVGMWMENNQLYVRSWFELAKPTEDEAKARIVEEIDMYGYKNVIIDGSWPGIISGLQNKRGVYVYGVNYSTEAINMIDIAAQYVHDMRVHFHPTYTEIINQLKAVRRDERGKPNKKLTRFDAGDCISQAIWHFERGSNFSIRKLKGKF